MTELKQIVICENCSHPVNELGTNRCPICNCPLFSKQSQKDDPIKPTVKKYMERFREAWEELAKK